MIPCAGALSEEGPAESGWLQRVADVCCSRVEPGQTVVDTTTEGLLLEALRTSAPPP
jgi:hypothetical protein